MKKKNKNQGFHSQSHSIFFHNVALNRCIMAGKKRLALRNDWRCYHWWCRINLSEVESGGWMIHRSQELGNAVFKGSFFESAKILQKSTPKRKSFLDSRFHCFICGFHKICSTYLLILLNIFIDGIMWVGCFLREFANINSSESIKNLKAR